MGQPPTERFGTAAWLQGATIAALIIWILIGALLLFSSVSSQVSLQLDTMVALAFFIGLFGVATLHYRRRAFIVDREGITVTGAFSFSHYGWDEVLTVEKHPGYLPGYTIVTRRGPLAFFTLEIPGHRKLFQWIEDYRGIRVSRGAPRDTEDDESEQEASGSSRARGRRRRRRHRR